MSESAEILQTLNQLCAGTVHDSLGIKFSGVGPDFLEAEMDVQPRVSRPGGFLHGGASILLAESVASAASYLRIDRATNDCFGVSIQANHLSAVTSGKVVARATPLKIGPRAHFWDVEVSCSEKKVVAKVQVMLMVVPLKT